MGFKGRGTVLRSRSEEEGSVDVTKKVMLTSYIEVDVRRRTRESTYLILESIPATLFHQDAFQYSQISHRPVRESSTGVWAGQ